MNIFPFAKILEQLPLKAVTPGISPEEAMSCLTLLTSFNGCEVGLVHFSGQTQWEIHRGGDELLLIIEGETELTQLIDGQEVLSTVRQGEAVQIPAGVWHTQRTLSPVKLIFFTTATGSEGRLTKPGAA